MIKSVSGLHACTVFATVDSERGQTDHYCSRVCEKPSFVDTLACTLDLFNLLGIVSLVVS